MAAPVLVGKAHHFLLLRIASAARLIHSDPFVEQMLASGCDSC
jgi:hypothetical protein